MAYEHGEGVLYWWWWVRCPSGAQGGGCRERGRWTIDRTVGHKPVCCVMRSYKSKHRLTSIFFKQLRSTESYSLNNPLVQFHIVSLGRDRAE